MNPDSVVAFYVKHDAADRVKRECRDGSYYRQVTAGHSATSTFPLQSCYPDDFLKDGGINGLFSLEVMAE